MLKQFGLSVLLFAVLLAVLASLRPWYSRWGATAEETQMTLPGDELMPLAARQSTLAVTITAAPDNIWPWLAQMSAERGGLYSYSWLERLLNCPIRNANRVIPEFQNPQVGDPVKMCPGDFGPSPHEIAKILPGKAFIFGGRDEVNAGWDSTWQFVLIPGEANTTRLVMRLRSATASAFDAVFDPAFFLMERRRLQGIKERASGQFPPEWISESEILLWIACFVLFLIAEGWLVFSRAWRRPAILAGITALVTLFLAFAQPAMWVDVLGAILIGAGFFGALRGAEAPAYLKIVTLCLLTSLLFSACRPLSQPVESTMEITTAIISPTAITAATQPPVEPEKTSYFEFGRTFSFNYDPKLASMVEARTVEAVPISPEVMFAESHPAFVQFSFLGYDGGRLFQLPYLFQTPQLMAFPTREFAAFSNDALTDFPQQLEDLRRLLDEQPGLTESCTRTAPVSGELALPFLPWLNSAQVFCAQPEYVKFNGGKGIRYLTAFSQGIEPLMDPSIFYTFQGLSVDGEFYYSAAFPVLTGIFPLEVQPGVDGQLPRNMNTEQLSALNAQPGNLFQPALGQLDALLSSLEAEK